MSATSPEPSLTLKRPQPRPRRWHPAVLGAVAAVLLIAAILLAVRYAWPRTVSTWRVQPTVLDQVVTGPATLDAIFKADVGSRVAGRLTQIFFDRNDRVLRGQIMATVEQDDLAAQVAAAQANFQAAHGALLAAQANLLSGQATLANAAATFERQSRLIKNGWVAQSGFDDAQAAVRVDQAQVAALKQGVAQAQAQRDAAQAALKASEVQRDIATVRAPFDGIVTVRNKSVGDVVGAATSIMQVVDPTSIVLTARFDESVIGAVHADQAAQIRFVFDPSRPIEAKVLRLSREVDTETREFTADVVPSHLPENWALDQRANVRIVLNRRSDVLTVPAAYVVLRDGNPGVWVVRNGRARWQSIDVADNQGEAREVRSGLAAGDTVLAPEGVYALMRVRQ